MDHLNLSLGILGHPLMYGVLFLNNVFHASKVKYCGVEWIFVPPSSELELEGPMLHMGDALGPSWLHGKKKPE